MLDGADFSSLRDLTAVVEGVLRLRRFHPGNCLRLVDGLICHTWLGAGWSANSSSCSSGPLLILRTLPVRSSRVPQGLSISSVADRSADPIKRAFSPVQSSP